MEGNPTQPKPNPNPHPHPHPHPHPNPNPKVPDGVPEAPSRYICFALDAVAHQLTVEWRIGRGWRLLQACTRSRSHHPSHETGGYTAFEWVTSGRACGGTNPNPNPNP